jgi:iron-sulfur cluster insertion protein
MKNDSTGKHYTLCYGMRLDLGTGPEQEHPHVPVRLPNGDNGQMALHVINGSLEEIKAHTRESMEAFFEILEEQGFPAQAPSNGNGSNSRGSLRWVLQSEAVNRKGDAMITITSKAEEMIRELMQEEKDAVGLRVFVKGGGCHGYQYGMSFESKVAEDDTVIEKGDVCVIMDSQSAPLLSGSEIDYVDSLQGSGFAVKNPQAKTTCGCGSSFSA